MAIWGYIIIALGFGGLIWWGAGKIKGLFGEAASSASDAAAKAYESLKTAVGKATDSAVETLGGYAHDLDPIMGPMNDWADRLNKAVPSSAERAKARGEGTAGNYWGSVLTAEKKKQAEKEAEVAARTPREQQIAKYQSMLQSAKDADAAGAFDPDTGSYLTQADLAAKLKELGA